MSLILFPILVYFFATSNHVHGRNCELEIDIEKNCYKQYTENYNYHHFFPVEKSNKNDDTAASVTFFIKADANAHILLSPTNNQTENDLAYEIILGSANNTASEIRRGHRAKSERAIMMKDAVNRTDWKGYWIRINVDGMILVGKKDEDLPFLHWKDPKPLPIKFYGFSSWDNTVALWAHQCTRNNESSLESAQQPVERSIDENGGVQSRMGFPTDPDPEEENSCQNYTTEISSYTEFFNIEKLNKTSDLLVNLTFYVLAESNAHVMLSSTLQPSEYEPVYEIVLGAANNTMSEIRRMQKAKSKASVKMTDAVSQNDWKVYWIRINNDGLVQVGREGEDRPFLYWKDPYPLQVKYYSFSTWDNVPTSWKHQCSNRFEEFAQLGQITSKSGQNFWDLYSTKNVKNQTCKIIRTRFFYHEYFPVEKSNKNSDDLVSILFYVQAKSDAHIFLSPRRNPNLNEPGYEIVLGSTNNTASEIRRGQKAENKVKVVSPGVVSANEWRGFWIRVKSTGLITVGKEGEDWPLMYWQDEKPLQINFYSLSSGISSDVLWEHQCSQVAAQPLARIQKDGDTPSENCQNTFTFNYTYTQFFSMEKSNLNGDNFVYVTFQVKADSNAHILLSRTPTPTEKEPVYEIVLGSAKNIATEIRKGQKTENRAMKYITNVLSHDEWKGYWIRVESDGLIMVGNDGEDFPFMYWKDPEPIKIEYYSFSSWLDTTALWKHRCPQSDEKSQKNITKNCKTFYTQGYNYFPLYLYEKSTTKKNNISFDLTFDVKADNLASVLLSTTPRPTDKEIVYEIIFASENNTLSEIRRGQRADTRTMAVIVMTDMAPRNEWKKYWIQILNDGSLLVGKVGDDLNLPFMRWKDPKPLQIKYYGFSSSANSIALWQHQCTQRNEQPVQVDSRSNVRLQQGRRARV